MSEVKQKDFISWLIDLIFGKPNGQVQSYQTYGNGYANTNPPNHGAKSGGCGCGMKK